MTSSGVFDTPIVQYSEKTKRFINELIRESRVNIYYQRKIEKALDRNVPLKNILIESKPEKATSGGGSVIYSDENHLLKAKWKSKRPKEAIKKQIANSKEEIFVPRAPKYDQGAKERCQDLMASNGEICRIQKVKFRNKETSEENNEDFSKENRRKQLLKEIEERVEWLSEMEELGAGSEYKGLIHSQIALRIRDIEFMDETLANIRQK